ncbi:MAG: VOC family protein [Minicystis sp.]
MMTIHYSGLDHVQVAAPPGCEAAARAFYGEVLGLPEVPKPAEMAKRGGCWFQCGGQQIHIGAEADFRAAKKAHPAILLADRASFEALAARLEAAGHAVKRDGEMEPAVERFFTSDPWGNRLELVFVAQPGTARP